MGVGVFTALLCKLLSRTVQGVSNRRGRRSVHSVPFRPVHVVSRWMHGDAENLRTDVDTLPIVGGRGQDYE